MLDKQPNIDATAFATEKDTYKSDNQWKSNIDNLWCTHGKKPRHKVESCWKLNWKPGGSQNRGWINKGDMSKERAWIQ